MKLKLVLQLAFCGAIPWFILTFPIGRFEEEAYDFPRLLAYLIIFFSLIHLILSLFRVQKVREAFEFSLDRERILFLAMVAAALFLINFIGFFTTGFALFLAISFFFGQKDSGVQFRAVLQMAGIAFLFMAAMYGLFVLVLKVNMPGGIFF